jgi:CBS domain-containing protein
MIERTLSHVVGNQRPLTLPPGASVTDACAQMRDRRAGCVLVADERGRLVGIFTAQDAVCRVVASGRNPAEMKLGEVMTPDPVSISPDHCAIDALRLMWDGGFHHVPLTKAGRVVGVVSRSHFKGFEYDRLDEERDLWEHLR